MKGKEAIINRINQNAVNKSTSIVESAEANSKKMLEEAKIRIEEKAKADKLQAERDAREINGYKVTVAERRARNIIIFAQQQLIDDTFNGVLEKINKMSEADYKSFLGTLILRHAENGDTVIPGKKDAKILTADFVSGLTAAKKIKLNISKETADFDKGLILENKGCEKNLSLEMLMREVKEKTEAVIAKKFFEVK